MIHYTARFIFTTSKQKIDHIICTIKSSKMIYCASSIIVNYIITKDSSSLIQKSIYHVINSDVAKTIHFPEF